ncbi:hypothetical protein SADUNF_Sadunf09G0112200 [Salix dunnii]|uniref:Uncharacterized protein n=1 Tax=Salix dunnii TaxID=1413687 RepID=A0A835JRR8_9ROSI|nr:hypothetical protein SADUNF_Sadunf09G0112200 [Salix dunnii]
MANVLYSSLTLPAGELMPQRRVNKKKLGPEQMNGDWIEWYQSFHEVMEGKTPCQRVRQIPHQPFSLIPCLTGNRVLYSAGEEFQSILNLSAGDLVSTKLWYDKKPFFPDSCKQIRIPFARNACSSFDDSSGRDFFALNELLASIREVLKRLYKLEISRFPKSLSHFFPVHFLSENHTKYMVRGSTCFQNLHVHGWKLDYNAARIGHRYYLSDD